MLLLNHIPVLCLLLSSAIAAAQVDESSTNSDEAASTDQADAQNDVLPRPGIEANQDGYPYNVSTIQLDWKYPHQDLPKLSTLLATPLVLTHTTEGWIGARPGHEVITSLAAINEAGGIIWSSALSDVVRVLTAVLIQDGLLGVVVRVDPEQISDNQANLFQDIRPEGDTDLKLILTVGRIKEVRTVASGDRVTEEDRVNSPLHVAIRNKSPLQGDREVDGEQVQGDLLRRKALEDYFLYLSRHPGRDVETSVAASTEPGGISLDFLVLENKPLSLYAELSNTGTKQEGYFRQRYGMFHSQLTGNDDTLSLEYLTSDFEKSNAIFGKYEAPLPGNDRIRWSIAGDWNEFVADEFGVLDDAFTGHSWSVTGNATMNLHQDGAFFLDLVTGLRLQNVSVKNNLFNVQASEDFLIPFLMFEADHRGDWSNFTGSLGVEFNTLHHPEQELSILGRIDPAENWAKLNWSAAYWTFLEPLLDPSAWNDPSTPESSTLAHELMLYCGGQWAFNSRLLPQFQYVMGGMYSVRGYPQSVAAGDSAILGKAEYRYHLPRAFAINPEPIELFGSDFR
ncbi:MAG: hypothetical protein P8L37_08780, partial [Phycisphaerales bacterium]|nr:hypothetical protein [Phycisphaerales bacterium]